jgi:hypothetical protein
MKKVLASCFVAASLATPCIAFAQFGSLPGFGAAKPAAPAADLGGQQSKLVKNFIAANVDILRANSKMSEALGLKNKAADADAVIAQLSSGATEDKDSATKASTAVGDTGGAIAAKIAEKPVLDAAAKATFAAGLVNLVSGASKFVGLGGDVKGMADGIKTVSPMQLTSFAPAMYVVQNFPTSATEVTKAVKNAVEFAKNNGIEVPADASKLL